MPNNLYYADIKTTFYRICSDLATSEQKSTLHKQRQIYDPPGITIIAPIEDKDQIPFKEAIEIMSSRTTFQPTKKLHFTLLGLFDDKRINSSSLEPITSTVKEYIKQKHIGRLIIAFNLVRPGAFYEYNRPKDYDSDGTVVAMADPKDDNTKLFINLGDDVACLLRGKFADIFYNPCPNRLTRPHPTVWCTLGYFEEPSFEITPSIVEIFEQVRNFNAVAKIDKLQVIQYNRRSLENAIVLDTIDL